MEEQRRSLGSSKPVRAHMKIDFGDLRRLEPVSRHFGYDRGTPIDRYYISQFLSAHRSDVKGRVVEVGDDAYTVEFGDDRVIAREILHISETNPRATIIADLASGESIPSNCFDCAIITQTLHLIFEPLVALQTLHRILKPGGVLLATAPGISPLSIDEWSEVWHWSFTRHSFLRLAQDVFGAALVNSRVYGNVLAATCFLEGIAVEEITTTELDHRDLDCDVLIGIRAQKAGAG
jgi:SAM-dependent methyltransferase